MIPSDDPTGLSRLYHINSEPWISPSVAPHVNHMDCGYSTNSQSRVALPKPGSSALRELIWKRRSAREFREENLSQEKLSILLEAAYGTLDIHDADSERFLRRSVPSGGGIYPLEIYVFLRRVNELEDGLYRFDYTSHSVELVWSRDMDAELQDAFISFPFIKNANVVLCHVAVFMRTQKKYGPRGYRYILLEAGHSAQNLCLAATELELGSLCMGGFWDGKLNQLLELDSSSAGAIYSVAIGHQ